MLDPRYAQDPEHYVRAYLLLQKDLEELFDYVEPSDQNLNCYSYRTHELLLRACVEVEANCKAILLENGYPKPRDDMNRNDYIKHREWFRPFAVAVPEEDCARYFECSRLCQSMNSLARIKPGVTVLPDGFVLPGNFVRLQVV